MTRQLRVGWLYGDIMNTYGDRGNILMLKHFATLCNIELTIELFSITSSASELTYDIVCMGGAEDWQQEIVSKDMAKKKAALVSLIEAGIPGIYICGAYQFMGREYTTAEGHVLKGLGVFPVSTRMRKSNEERLIGDCIVRITHDALTPYIKTDSDRYLIGFENHGGRTTGTNPIGKVIKGFGNNGSDMLEGCIAFHSLGSYLHGPLIARNPLIAEFVLDKALTNKYTQHEPLQLRDAVVEENRNYLLHHVKGNF